MSLPLLLVELQLHEPISASSEVVCVKGFDDLITVAAITVIAAGFLKFTTEIYCSGIIILYFI